MNNHACPNPEQCNCKEDELLTNSIKPMTTRKKILIGVAAVFVVAFAIACGITTGGIAYTVIIPMLVPIIPILHGAIVSLILSSFLGVATTVTNIKMCKKAVADVFIKMFGMGRIFAGLTQSLSAKQRLAMGIGLLLALSAGITFAALSYSSAIALTAAIPLLAGISVAFPPVIIAIAAVLAVVTFVCLSALLFNAITNIIKTENLVQKCKHALKNLIDTNPELPRNQGKSHPRIVFERIVTVGLTLVFVPLATVAVTMTMVSCAHGLTLLLMKLPHAAPEIAKIVSYTTCLLFAQLAQLPFVFTKMINVSANIFNKAPSKQKAPDDKPTSVFKKTLRISLSCVTQFLRIVSALGNGLVAASGAHGPTTAVAVVGGTLNSFAAAGTDPQSPETKPLIIEVKKTSSSQKNEDVLNGLDGLEPGCEKVTNSATTSPEPARKNVPKDIKIITQPNLSQGKSRYSDNLFFTFFNSATKKNVKHNFNSVYLNKKIQSRIAPTYQEAIANMKIDPVDSNKSKITNSHYLLNNN